MRAYTFTENGYTFKRINKKQARQAYSNGLTVRFCPCNLRPGSPFRLDMDINKINQNCAGETFDSIVLLSNITAGTVKRENIPPFIYRLRRWTGSPGKRPRREHWERWSNTHIAIWRVKKWVQ